MDSKLLMMDNSLILMDKFKELLLSILMERFKEHTVFSKPIHPLSLKRILKYSIPVLWSWVKSVILVATNLKDTLSPHLKTRLSLLLSFLKSLLMTSHLVSTINLVN